MGQRLWNMPAVRKARGERRKDMSTTQPARRRWAVAAAAVAALALTACGTAQRSASPPAPSPPAPGPVRVQGTGPSAPASGLGGAVAVVVDNEAQARPQSGIERAGLVFEAPAEGGITRFLAVFWPAAAAQIGPVRSTRIYFDQLAQAYRLPLAHAGGNVDALAAVRTLHLENLDEIWTPGAAPFFWRSSARPAPHNLYTSTSLLLRAVHSLGLTLGPVPTWPRGPVQGGRPAASLRIAFSGVETATWRYRDGVYARYEGAAPDDTLGGHAVQARAVLVLFVGEAPDPDPSTPGSVRLDMTGQGQGLLVAEGRAVSVRWRRSPGEPFRVLAPDGAPQPMPAPPLWIELVPPGASVSVSP
jgi:hypothetical protein